MKQIPNIFTLLNLVLGCIAIVYILENGITLVEDADGFTYPNWQVEKFYLAPLFIVLAAVVDFFDGFVARLFNNASEFGKQLDSLADVVSFGVAPSMIIYQLLKLSVAREANGLEASMMWLVPAFVLAAAAAYRLAKFNLSKDQSHTFKGTPVPAVGILVASFPLIYWNTQSAFVLDLLTNKWFLYALVAILSGLMVSNLPIMSNKPKEKTVSGLMPQILLAIITIIAAFLIGWLAVPVAFIFFVVLSVIFKNKLV